MAVLTKIQIIAKIDLYILENTTGSITAVQLNEILNDITDSYADGGATLVASDSAKLQGLTKAELYAEFLIALQNGSEFTNFQDIIDSINDSVTTSLASKADLVGGTIPDAQIPAGITRDSELAAALAALVNASPATLDTLNELALALGNDPNFATTMTTALANKMDKFKFEFASKGAVGAVNIFEPTLAEIQNFANNLIIRDKFIHYTSTATNTDPNTHLYYADKLGLVLLVQSNKVIDDLGLSLESKADLVGGTIPDSQIPAGITRDSELAAALAALVNASPTTLDTLNEIALALGNDRNFATTITTALANKIDKYAFAFASSTTVGAVDVNNPTIAELATWNAANGNNRNKHIKYTGTSISSDIAKYVYYIDNSGEVLKVYGNKKVLFISESKFATLAGTLPTTTEATRTLATATGVNYVTLSGAVNAVNSCVFALRVPDDYNGGGFFNVLYTFAAGSTLNFVLKGVFTKMDNSSVSDGIAVTVPTAFTTETNSPRKDIVLIPALTFIPGEIIYVRLWREANDVGDTSLSNLLLTGCEFKYN